MEQEIIQDTAETTVAEQEYQEPASDSVHIFYYAWYRSKEHDGQYSHWNHEVLAHWTEVENNKYKGYIGSILNPEEGEIGANYWPSRGLYSSRSKQIVRDHFVEIKTKSKINVVVVSWWGVNHADRQGKNQEELMPLLFDTAKELNMKIAFHMEPYASRTAQSTKEDLKYIMKTYSSHPAFYKVQRNGKELPLLYIYDSYLTKANEWATILDPAATNTIRNTDHDAVMIGLWVNQADEQFFLHSHFDGFYTYFASVGFTFGSTPSNWRKLSEFATQHNKIFIPSVGPGYIDTKIRPWNAQNTKERNGGQYYDSMFSNAIKEKPDYISVTSYNEWHEGTQIEPCLQSKTNKKGSFKYLDYGHDEEMYLAKTAHWVEEFEKTRNPNN